MNYAQAKTIKADLEQSVATLGRPLAAYAKNGMGFTPDHIRATPAWQADKAAYDAAFAKLRAFNQWFCKAFRKEYRAEQRNEIRAYRASKAA